MLQRESLDNTIFIDLDLPIGFESINPGSKYYKDSVLPVLIYESSRLLVKYPMLNSFFSNGNVILRKEICIGIATDIDGVKMIELRQPDKMSLYEIEEKLFSGASSYRVKNAIPVDPAGITFTVSDILANGVYFSTPIIHKGDTSILGISKIDKKLNRIIFSFVFDQRVVENNVATAFLFELKQRIESYISLQKIATDKLMCSKCMRRISEDFNNKGFIKIITNKGEEKLICDLCLLNY